MDRIPKLRDYLVSAFMNFSSHSLCAVFLAALACQSLSASPIPIGDFSFEGNSLGPDAYSSNIGPEWIGTGGSNDGNAFEEYIPGFVSQGTDHLGMEQYYSVWQDLGVTYQANTRYTLTVGVGNRPSGTNFGNQSQYILTDSTGTLWAGDSYSAINIPSGTFADATPLVFETPTDPASVGKTIRILLFAGGSGRSHFDNIRLDATPMVVTGGATVINLPATSITGNSATISGQITSIGDDAPVVTLFWGTTSGNSAPANWDHSITLSGTQTGTFSAPITGLSGNSTYYFAARATNSAGNSWALPTESFETLSFPPAVATGTATQIGGSSATLAAAVTDTGGEPPLVTIYYGPSDGGDTPGNWAASVPLGALASSGSAAVSGLTSGTAYWFRAYAQNSGGSAWAASSGTFSTLTVSASIVVNDPPTGITGTTANLRGDVTNDGNDAPMVTIFYGTSDGETTPGSWANQASAGVQGGDFTRFVSGLTPDTTYFFRCRAENQAGTSWAPETATFTTTALVSSIPVIHEIHYHAQDDPILGPLPLEFIELTNPGDETIDLSGWKLANAVKYTFPEGSTLAPGGYLVIAQDPAALLTAYGKTAIGPWSGKLSNSGETIELRDASNAIQDSVSYQPGFPWPTAADGEAPSMELIHPSLDNDLGGSWRSSNTPAIAITSFIAAGSSQWRYKRGTAEASSPVEQWRNLSYNDSSGWTSATAPFGYGGNYFVATNVNNNGAMRRVHRSMYYRKSFTIAGSLPEKLVLNVRYDDAFVAWINGVEVKRSNNAPAGQIPYNLSDNVTIGGHSASSYESFTINTVINGVNLLVGGTNVLCVHSLNESTGSSDYYFDASLTTAGGVASSNPTPGDPNGARLDQNLTPPQVRQVSHAPTEPAAGQDVTITARITDPEGMGAVSLAYQIVNPGNYIRLSDPAYATTWTTAAMVDNGINGDVLAGDSVFTAVIPASVQTHRRIIRYKVTGADSLGNGVTVPYADDEQPNFAYFVYNGVPDWTGAIRPTSFNGFPATSPVTYPASTLNSVATYHLIANATDVTNCQYNGSFNGVRFQGTFVYDGVVYDHIQFKNRGIGSTYQAGKNKWNIFFNRARDLQARDNYGKKYAETWNNLPLNANASPWAPLNRGSGGIEEASSARLYELAGNNNFRTHYVHLRVIDEAVESSPSSQFVGDLWGLYLALEPTEGNFLDERGLPDGNIYSIEGNSGDKKHQGENQPVDSSDWNSFRNALQAGGQTEAWYRANMDLDKLYTFLAINRLIGNVDVRPGDNYRYFHRSSDNKWEILAYDLDMMYIAAHHWGGTMDGVTVAGQPNSILAIMRHPALAREYRNRCRELLDLLASDSAANGGQIGQLLNEYASLIHPTGQTATWANLDAALWNLNPRTNGDGGNSGQGSHKGNFFRATFYDSRGVGNVVGTNSWTRTLSDPDFDGFSNYPGSVKWFVDFATNTYPGNAAPWKRKASEAGGGGNDPDINRQKGYGYKYLEWETLYGGWTDSRIEPTIPPHTDFPNKPTLTASGDPTFPVSELTFTPSPFADPQGVGTFAAWQWRIAEISAPGIPGYVSGDSYKYEINPLATSEELTGAPAEFSIPLGIATVGKTYRVRVRQKDNSGNWSHWSDPAQFAATENPATLVHYWNFNDAENFLAPTQTVGGGTIAPSATLPSEVISNSSNQGFVGANARNGDPAGAHLRVNNPLGASLDLALPTYGHSDIIVKYETRRSGQGAGTQNVSYTLDGTTFLPFEDITVTDGDPVEQILDFRGVSGVEDNPHFGLRIAFIEDDGGTSGNNRFDNLTVDGKTIVRPPAVGYWDWKVAAFPDPAEQADESISGPQANPSGDGVANLIRYALGVGPNDSVLHLMPKLVTAGSDHEFRFRYDATKPDLVWRVVATNDPQSWPTVLFDSRTSPLPPLDDGWLPLSLPAYLGAGPAADAAMFVRLEISLVTP